MFVCMYVCMFYFSFYVFIAGKMFFLPFRNNEKKSWRTSLVFLFYICAVEVFSERGLNSCSVDSKLRKYLVLVLPAIIILFDANTD